jgi:hypothetical protein
MSKNTRFLIIEKHLNEASSGIPGGHRLVDSANSLEELLEKAGEKAGRGFDSSSVEMRADGSGAGDPDNTNRGGRDADS